jgi:hypothetical protein
VNDAETARETPDRGLWKYEEPDWGPENPLARRDRTARSTIFFFFSQGLRTDEGSGKWVKEHELTIA